MPFKNNEAKCFTCGQEYFMVKLQKIEDNTATIKIFCANEDCSAYTHPYSVHVEGEAEISDMLANFKQ